MSTQRRQVSSGRPGSATRRPPHGASAPPVMHESDFASDSSSDDSSDGESTDGEEGAPSPQRQAQPRPPIAPPAKGTVQGGMLADDQSSSSSESDSDASDNDHESAEAGPGAPSSASSPSMSSVAPPASARQPPVMRVDSEFSFGDNEAASSSSAAAVSREASDTSPMPPLLSTFTPGIRETCEICDDNQARIYCAQCNLRLCYGTAPDGTLRGCVIDMHRNAERAEHSRYEWTSHGRGKLVTFQPNAPATPPRGRLSTSRSEHSDSVSGVAALSSPLTPLPLGHPPPLVAAPNSQAACELCDENLARVFCAECNMRLCFGSTASGNLAGCVVDMHRNSERINHKRYEWTQELGRGRQLAFEQQLPPSPTVQKAQEQAFLLERAQAEVALRAEQREVERQQQLQEQREQDELHRQREVLLQQQLEEEERQWERRQFQQQLEADERRQRQQQQHLDEEARSREQQHSHPPPASHSSPLTASPDPATASSSYPGPVDTQLLSSVLADPAAWTPQQVCDWLSTLSPSLDSLHGVFLALGVTGRMVLALTDSQLRNDLEMSDASLRRLVLDGVARLSVHARGILGSSSAAAMVGASSRPFPTEMLSATQTALEAHGFQEDPALEQRDESLYSLAVPFTRAQLFFMLSQRNRLITQLAQENQELRQQLAARDTVAR